MPEDRLFRRLPMGGKELVRAFNSPLKGKDAGLQETVDPYAEGSKWSWKPPFYHAPKANERYHPDARSLQNLKDEIAQQKIAFCKGCVISMMSCKIHPEFTRKLAQITKCKVVANRVKCRVRDNNKDWYSVDDDKVLPKKDRGFYESDEGSEPKSIGGNYTPPPQEVPNPSGGNKRR